MRKILFSDKYGLTEAVLEGRKTMTRRIVRHPEEVEINGHRYLQTEKLRYKVGEVVAVAQKYKDVREGGYPVDSRYDAFRDADWGIGVNGALKGSAGETNKMFVRANLMPHQIRITNVRVERLQDISEEDVYKEGFAKETVNNGWGNYAHHWEAILVYYDSNGRTREIRSPYPREAFAVLIDRISGKGTWEANPWVYVYEFELVK